MKYMSVESCEYCLLSGNCREETPGSIPDDCPLDDAPKSQWQPIETAPKDGTLILLLEKNYLACAAPGRWRAETSISCASWFDAEYGECFSENFTHWIPLPEVSK